ncbi:CLK4-associating serine/arginine rich protein [Macrosteles quadrilineatus]|uniref:CLK4-associating serine/arginine rich protein n=1 Tax=Macrosteles quadrilineatus TaxID=74068 RepID=UPI0023E1E98B|nr:CLK4-associating serine/arginine rich protein [Macrosteles quadrilineatus]
MMWQEARKQEKKIRGMLVDYKRRAERRKDYYEKIKADPTQFIQLHGRPCKIHLDPAVAIAGDSPANMMSWQGNHDILIDRFDVRAHLDFIPENTSKKDEDDEVSQEERYINYERYRILAQNDFLGVSEDKFLQQLALEEQFGPVEKSEPPPIEGKKKVPGAAIGYNYNEGSSANMGGSVSGIGGAGEPPAADKDSSDDDDNDEEEDEDSDIDFDLCVDVNKISSAQAHEMNAAALAYGMCSNDFFSFLTRDVEEAETLKLAREREEEKAMFSGRKSRRERRAFREKKLVGRKLSPPSYAASKAAPIVDLIRNVPKAKSRSRSRSVSPPNAGMIQYITSFGGDEVPLEPPPPQAIKTSVHASKEDDKTYKRTVRYRSSRSPDSARKRSSDRTYGSRRRSRSHSPSWRSRSPVSRTVRYHSRSPVRSPSRSDHNHRNTSYRRRRSASKSKSSSPVQRIVKKLDSPQPIRSVEVPAPPVITRYYGRHKNESSSSELDLSDSDDKNDQNSEKTSSDKNVQAVGNAGGRSKPGSSSNSNSKMSLQERLKKKRQALINRQYKADKKAERLRLEKAEQERQDREDEMREISIKMRRRERQKRHQYYEMDDTNAADMSDEDRFSSASSTSGSEKQGSGSEQRSHSRSSKKSNRTQDLDRSRNSRERDRSRERKDSYRERGRTPERDRERDRWSKRRDREDERPYRDRSRERTRDSRDARDREASRDIRDREASRDIRDREARDREARDRSRDRHRRGRDREWTRDRERRRSRERDYHDGSVVVKAKRPLVDY